MDFHTQVAGPGALSRVAADALLVVIVGDTVPALLDKTLAAPLRAVVEAGDLALKAGRSVLLHQMPKVAAPRVAFVVAADASTRAFAKAIGTGLGLLKGGGSKHVAVALVADGAVTAAQAQLLPQLVADATYVYRHTKPSAPAASSLSRVTLLMPAADAGAAAALVRGAAIAEGVTLARECANRPANHGTPTFLAGEAKRLGKELGLKVEILDRKDVEKLGMGAFVAVAQGSEEPLKFIVARWQGAPKAEAPIVLVGKGITFDTGGISLKPGEGMDEMKFDMGGAASVLGTLSAVARLKARVNLIGVIAACENMPDGRAIKPGDVVTSLSGQTIEILNTDAEGRLILCDALTYVERFKPAVVVDIATLTGACMVALGLHRTGLFTADDELAAELLGAGDTTLDVAWRMPLDEEYGEGLKSNFADVANIGGRFGGSSIAAVFLQRFTAKYRWAHLDIAGTAWVRGTAKGGTGRPVPLLTQFVLSRAAV